MLALDYRQHIRRCAPCPCADISIEQSASRDVAGGTSLRSIKAQIKQARRLLNAAAQRNGKQQ
jgi:hypothetical protein